MDKYTINQIGQLFGWSKQGVWWHVARGHFAVVYEDGTAVVSGEELRRYASERAEAARVEAERWERIAEEV